MNENLPERIGRSKKKNGRDRDRDGDDRWGTAEVMILPPKVNGRVSEYFVEPVVTGGGWLAKSEFPTAGEVLDLDDDNNSSSTIVELSANRPESRWDSKEEYLAAQYLLNREDSIRGLREAVTSMQRMPESTEDAFNGKVGIYEKVCMCLFCLIILTNTTSGSHLRNYSITAWSGPQDHIQHTTRWQGHSVGAVQASDRRRSRCPHPGR